jgi:CubicO group peptidase (beta-lactamase class C family)
VQEHVTERLLGPLGLTETSWMEPTDRRWARPRRWEDGQSVPDLPHPIGDGEIAPMGGLWTTVHDLARWVAWLDDANVHPHQPDAVGLSPASRREMQRFNTYVGRTTLAGRTCPAGYGFGLNVRDDAGLGMVVSHSGGLPGYGSNMRWIAGSGVGAIALANTTYAPMSELTMRMLVRLHELGALPTPPPIAAPDVEVAARRLVALLNDWTDSAADALFADNVALDESYTRRADAARRLVGTHGLLRIVAVHPESATSGEVEVQGTGDPFRIDFQLAPLAGTPVQLYGLPPDLSRT